MERTNTKVVCVYGNVLLHVRAMLKAYVGVKSEKKLNARQAGKEGQKNRRKRERDKEY